MVVHTARKRGAPKFPDDSISYPLAGTKRTFTGCWTCRSRKVKCDDRVPFCTPCIKTGLECTGYQQNLVWVSSDQKTYRHNARRLLNPTLTWQNVPTLSQVKLDKLIDQCDDEEGSDSDHEDSSPTTDNPFHVFRATSYPPSESQSGSGGSAQESPANLQLQTSIVIPNVESDTDVVESEIDDQSWVPTMAVEDDQESLPLALQDSPRLDLITSEHAYLFHHYITHVVPMLTPTHNMKNPWLRYPTIALHNCMIGQTYLLHAMMAHAAIFQGNTDENCVSMHKTGIEFYLKAMAELRKCIDSDRGSIEFVGVLTTMLTFLLIETFQGNSKNWKFHLRAAWKFIQQHQQHKPWDKSEDAWYVTQSFCLLRIQYGTTAALEDDPELRDPIDLGGDQDNFYGTVASNPLFGDTLGSCSLIMESIAEVNRLARVQSREPEAHPTAKPLPFRLVRMLTASQEDLEPYTRAGPEFGEVMAAGSVAIGARRARGAHLQAYKVATLIYYYQVCEKLLPRDLATYVTEVLDCLSTYVDGSGGNPTLWPAFIAGAEAYTDDDKIKVLDLFQITSRTGMRSRVKMLSLLQRIWEIRSLTAMSTGKDPGLVRVDWRQVVEDMSLDILIV